ncbi:MAG: hypothetical protein AAF355_04560 [Myxococcota bacterium]
MSDHGEILNEDGLLDHGRSVIAANIDVFGLVVSPKYPPGVLSNSPVQSQDLFSTLEASDEVESLLQEARSLMQAARGTLGSAVQLSPAEQEALRALGYLR